MTKEEIQIIKRTWKLFRGINPMVVGDAFYSKLFSDHPALRKMFPDNMEAQYKKLIDMLNSIVMRLDDISTITNEIQTMAQRHVTYGVRPAHYKIVGNALLWTLQQGLGRDWNTDTETAWTHCYTMLAETMIKASTTKPAPYDS